MLFGNKYACPIICYPACRPQEVYITESLVCGEVKAPDRPETLSAELKPDDCAVPINVVQNQYISVPSSFCPANYYSLCQTVGSVGFTQNQGRAAISPFNNLNNSTGTSSCSPPSIAVPISNAAPTIIFSFILVFVYLSKAAIN